MLKVVRDGWNPLETVKLLHILQNIYQIYGPSKDICKNSYYYKWN